MMADETLVNVTQMIYAGQAKKVDGATPRLVAVSGPLTGAHFAIVTDPVTIGREETCSIQLAATGVSRQHCRVVREDDGGLAIVDGHSTNGTIVNGRQLKAEAHRRLHHGDTIRICDSNFFFLSPQSTTDAAAAGKIEIDLGAAAKEAEGFL